MAKGITDIDKIEVSFPKHSKQRYDTLGDWYFVKCCRKTILKLTGSKEMGFLSALAVVIHELVETVLCMKSGVTQEQVDEFDMTHNLLDDPGMSPDAPYHFQHLAALKVERAFCEAVGLTWKKHEANMDKVIADNKLEHK